MRFPALQVAIALALVLGVSAAQAQGDKDAAHAKLAVTPTPGPALILSDEEHAVVLGSVDTQGDSTLALGFLTIGADVPRTIELKGFPETVLEKVSKLKGYKYFSAEGRIAIVDPKRAKVQMVLEPRR